MQFFKIIHQSRRSRARVGQLWTEHGVIDTPAFVPVGTNGTLKAVDMVTTTQLDVDLIFCNTYHLMLQPGADIIHQAGGLHAFSHRTRPIITDSGGFQVFSLAYGNVACELKSQGKKKNCSSVEKITEAGVLFRSYRDGTKILLTPERSIQEQKKIGADIIVAFDELLPYHTTPKDLKKSFDRTHRWEQRSLDEHLKNVHAFGAHAGTSALAGAKTDAGTSTVAGLTANAHRQFMYGIIHGGIDDALRQQSCEFLANRAFDGMAIGGSVGKNRDEMIAMLSSLAPHLPPERPRHLLGIGDIPSIEAALPLGIDTFDSAHPTKIARHGLLLVETGATSELGGGVLGSGLLGEEAGKGVVSNTDGRVRGVRARGGLGSRRIAAHGNAVDFGPVEEGCTCFTCVHYSMAYLHHLFKAHEPVVLTLASIHNTHFMMRYMAGWRERILRDEV